MTLSKAIIPTLKGKAASSIVETLKEAKLKPYSEDEKINTEKRFGKCYERKK